MKKLQLTFNSKYSTIHRIGLSDVSEVYLALDAATEKQYAIKLEPLSDLEGHLERQAKIYRLIKDGVGFPHLYWYGVQNQYKALVTDVYGPSLQQLLQFCGGKFSLKTVLLIADQLLDRIEWVHSKKLTYNDMCPSNFLVGLKEKADKIFMIDFGNCKKYIDDKSKHIELGDDKKTFGADLRFKSVHAHINKNLSRRDDLESLGYLIIYFLKGTLPWQDIIEQQKSSANENLIKEQKVSIPIALLCEDLDEEFRRYFEYVRSLQFEEEPDYAWIKRLFQDLFENRGFANNKVMDWAEKHEL